MTGPAASILVVEDDADLLSLMEMILGGEGYRVRTAREGGEALARVKEEMPSLVFLDMRMPGMNGWEFAREFRARHGAACPIVVVTAAEDARRRAEEIEAQGWLAKPFEIADVLAWTPEGPFDNVIDADRMIAMPGMVNAHCHSAANLVRGMMPSKPLEIWRAYYRASLRDMREEDFYASALLGGMEMLKSGATTVLDHFFGNQACRFMGAGAAIQAMRDLGLRHVVSLTLSDKNYEETIPLGNAGADLGDEIKRMSASEAKGTQAWLDDCEAFIETFHVPEKLTTACPGPSAVQRCTDELLTRSAEMARKRNLPMHIHLAETKAQAVMGQRIYGTSLLTHLDALGVLAPNLSLAHSIWVEPGDVELFAKRRATPVHNPASNLRIGSGLAPATTARSTSWQARPTSAPAQIRSSPKSRPRSLESRWTTSSLLPRIRI